MAALTEKFIEQTPSRHLGHVRVDEVRGDGLGRLAALDAVGDLLEGVGRDRVEHRVHEGHVLGRADGAELEAVAAVGEGRRAVAVLRGDLHVAHALDAHGQVLRLRLVLAAALRGLIPSRNCLHSFSLIRPRRRRRGDHVDLLFPRRVRTLA